MARYERFTFLCNENERQLIVELATRLQRSQSDAVRFVVIEATRRGVISINSNKNAGEEKSISESLESLQTTVNKLEKAIENNLDEQLQSLSKTVSTIKADLESGA